MTWATLIPLIAQYGIPFVTKLIDKWTNNPNGAPTAAEWQELVTLSQQTAKTQMLAALSRAGIDPNSPQGQALLAEVP